MSFRPLGRKKGQFRELAAGTGSFEPLNAPPPAKPPAESRISQASADPDAAPPKDPGVAEREGFEAGYREGLAAARKELSEMMSLSRDVIQELEITRSRIASSSRNDLLDVLTAVTEWLLYDEIERGHDLITRVVDAAMKEFQEDESITIVLNPADHDALAAELSIGRKSWASWDLTLSTDETIQPGGCRIQSPGGDLDATVEDRLQRLREELSKHSDRPAGGKPGVLS